MQPMNEWRAIPSTGGVYEVTQSGRVRRAVGGQGTRAGRELRTHLNQRGYPIAKLCIDGKQRTRTVHALVAEAFIGPRPSGYEVHHKDHCKSNNHVSNLEYVTHSRNIKEAAMRGIGTRFKQPAGISYQAPDTRRGERRGARSRTQRQQGRDFWNSLRSKLERCCRRARG